MYVPVQFSLQVPPCPQKTGTTFLFLMLLGSPAQACNIIQQMSTESLPFPRPETRQWTKQTVLWVLTEPIFHKGKSIQ